MLCENKLKVPEFLPKLHFLHKKKFLFDFIFSPISITDRDVAKIGCSLILKPDPDPTKTSGSGSTTLLISTAKYTQ